MKAVICDTDINCIKCISKKLENIFQDNKQALTINFFTKALLCLDYLLTNEVDFVVLNTHLDNGNFGIDLARKLRDRGKDFKLIFISQNNYFAVQSYEVNATYYLLKPIEDKALYLALKRCNVLLAEDIVEVKVPPHKTLLLKTKDIIAVEVQNKVCTIYLTTGLIKNHCPLYKIAEKLNAPEFLSVHRSYLINMNHVKRLENDCFLMKKDIRIPIRTAKRNQIYDKYTQYLYKNA